MTFKFYAEPVSEVAVYNPKARGPPSSTRAGLSSPRSSGSILSGGTPSGGLPSGGSPSSAKPPSGLHTSVSVPMIQDRQVNEYSYCSRTLFVACRLYAPAYSRTAPADYKDNMY